MGQSEWNSIFQPHIMQGEVYRNLKLAVVQQEIAAYEGAS